MGYIPRVETKKKEMFKAREGYKRITNGWEFIGKEEMAPRAQSLFEECDVIEQVRDFIRVEMEHNGLDPVGKIASVRWKDGVKWNSDGVGKLMSMSILLDD